MEATRMQIRCTKTGSDELEKGMYADLRYAKLNFNGD